MEHISQNTCPRGNDRRRLLRTQTRALGLTVWTFFSEGRAPGLRPNATRFSAASPASPRRGGRSLAGGNREARNNRFAIGGLWRPERAPGVRVMTKST
jgi:hypothetical protein